MQSIFWADSKNLDQHKRFWTCKRTRHKCSQISGLAQKVWTGTKHFGTCKMTRHKTCFFILKYSMSNNGSIITCFVKPLRIFAEK